MPQFKLHITDIEDRNRLLESLPPGVRIEEDPEFKSPVSTGMAFDSIGHILNMIIVYGRDISVSLIASWLYDKIRRKPDGEWGRIGGTKILRDQIQLDLFIKVTIESNSSDSSEHNGKATEP